MDHDNVPTIDGRDQLSSCSRRSGLTASRVTLSAATLVTYCMFMPFEVLLIQGVHSYEPFLEVTTTE